MSDPFVARLIKEQAQVQQVQDTQHKINLRRRKAGLRIAAKTKEQENKEKLDEVLLKTAYQTQKFIAGMLENKPALPELEDKVYAKKHVHDYRRRVVTKPQEIEEIDEEPLKPRFKQLVTKLSSKVPEQPIVVPPKPKRKLRPPPQETAPPPKPPTTYVGRSIVTKFPKSTLPKSKDVKVLFGKKK
jgi:hypothetical protein